MPNDSSDFTYVIYPLQSGYCKLPKFNVKLSNSKLLSQNNSTSVDKGLPKEEPDTLGNLETIVQSMIPSQIFIMPQTTCIPTLWAPLFFIKTYLDFSRSLQMFILFSLIILNVINLVIIKTTVKTEVQSLL